MIYKSNQPICFMLPTCKGIEIINVNVVIRIEALSNYSKIYFENGTTLVVAKLLRWFEEKLPVQQFVRTHRTHLVNKNFMACYNKSDKIKLTTGDFIDVARRKKKCLIISLLNLNV